MELIVILLLLAVQGLVIGAFARLALPGRDPLSLLQTMGIGLAGSFLGGLVMYGLLGQAESSFLAALVVSVGIVYVIRRRRGGGLIEPGGDRRH